MTLPKLERKEELLKHDFEVMCRRSADWTIAAQGVARDYVTELERVVNEVRSNP